MIYNDLLKLDEIGILLNSQIVSHSITLTVNIELILLLI